MQLELESKEDGMAGLSTHQEAAAVAAASRARVRMERDGRDELEESFCRV